MYDGRIGRWLSVDPMRQYVSPYVGMGNSPVSSSDPTGGFNYPTEEAAQQAARAQGIDPSTVYNNGGKSGWGFNTVGKDGSINGHFGGFGMAEAAPWIRGGMDWIGNSFLKFDSWMNSFSEQKTTTRGI